MKPSALLSVLFGLLLFCFAPAALAAYEPPEMTGHVTDPAGRLSDEMVTKLNAKLESYRLRTGNEIAVFLPATLGGYPIDDVGFETARRWKLGAGHNDNGVLLVIAPVERKVRIEVGKGVEGALTDLQSNDIIQKMKPRLRSGEWGLAADEGTDEIISTLDSGGARSAPAPHKPATPGDVVAGLVLLVIIFGIPILFIIGIASAIGRAFTSNGRSAYRGWSTGSSWSSDSSWSSSGGSSWSSSDSGGSSFGSDFSGGGGDFGGGGSSDSF